MVKIIYLRNFLGKEERKIEGEDIATRKERESEKLGQDAPFLFFSLTRACWSVGGGARVWSGSRSFFSLF